MLTLWLATGLLAGEPAPASTRRNVGGSFSTAKQRRAQEEAVNELKRQAQEQAADVERRQTLSKIVSGEEAPADEQDDDRLALLLLLAV